MNDRASDSMQSYCRIARPSPSGYFAANLAGSKPVPHPGNLEVHPWDGSVYKAITGGNGESDLFKLELGQILRLTESPDAPESRRFQWSRFSIGGEPPGRGG